jgi:predicted RND superfamily exporter protein
MWRSLAKFVIKNRIVLLILLLLGTGVMGYYASKVKLSYEFTRAIPTDNPKYQDYVAFRQKFGDDGNLLVIGVQSKELFQLNNFKAYQQLQDDLKKVKGVEDILSVPGAVTLVKDSATEKLNAVRIFSENIETQAQLDSEKAVLYSLPFYNQRLYNNDSSHYSYLMAVRINKDVLATKERSVVVANVNAALAKFEDKTKADTHISGLPLIRTVVGDRIQKEMKIFLFASLGLSVLILLLFFRSVSTTLLSLAVVLVGVIWTVATIYLCGYQITLLTALIPSLVVVIGIPNCIYFINKYHTSYLKDEQADPTQRKNDALVAMVSKMGVVTLFCNLTAAIGFAVFALTKSAILKEFGVVAGISIMVIFFISFILLPSVLSLLPVPGKRQLGYLHSKWIENVLNTLEKWVFVYRKRVLVFTTIIVLLAIAGIMRLKTVAYIVDDLPKKDKIYTDLKFFEQNFKGVMPLEIVIDTKKRRGLTGMKALSVFEKVDSLAAFIGSMKEMNKPLSIAEGLKFAKQGFYEGDSANYSIPNSFDGAFVADYLKPAKDDSGSASNFSKMLHSFIDTSSQMTRISVSMADVGTKELPLLLEKIASRSNQLFDSTKYYFTQPDRTSKYTLDTVVNEIDSTSQIDTVFTKYDTIPQYKVTLTGTSITFLEGSKFIISGLKESVFWAFVLIAVCMLFLFKSVRILLCSLIPNVIPLLITAGIMGWVGVPLKPSTVLIFSVALGIAIDITIRFLVNYKQVLPENGNDVSLAVRHTIHQTGLSIIYTSLVLTAGFIIFCASSFGGTFALGWLTSVTLFTATITNLVLLPVLLLLLAKKNKVIAK